MPVLPDTHAFRWWCGNSRELSKNAKAAIVAHDCFVSYASFWEIAIKISLNRLRLPDPIDRYIGDQISINGFDHLPIDLRHITRCSLLQWHHRDPFDRLLAAQALEENVDVVSKDPAFDNYGVRRIW